MSNQALNQVLNQGLIIDPKATVTNVSWDEVQKIAQVGDIISQHGSTFTIALKQYVQQMDNSYEIKLYKAD
ncbi:hypothetical protein BOO88_03410 [Stutzerimonas stutzeri]|jgi:hypothetical protein|nr:hypothetical protein BOO89_15475 [Stutzerimonas stutzeri]AZO88026.1 hypothetical protein BOO88_03410 [Stutzerimonas stutzeri]